LGFWELSIFEKRLLGHRIQSPLNDFVRNFVENRIGEIRSFIDVFLNNLRKTKGPTKKCRVFRGFDISFQAN
jgi:hypothetical protein